MNFLASQRLPGTPIKGESNGHTGARPSMLAPSRNVPFRGRVTSEPSPLALGRPEGRPHMVRPLEGRAMCIAGSGSLASP